MQSFFVSGCKKSGASITIDDNNQVHHIRDVLRLKPAEEVVVFDGEGREYICVIESVAEKVVLNIKNEGLPLNDNIRLTVACAIPKKAKFDDIVDKLTQLGVTTIIPLKTARVIVKLDKKKEKLRLERWRKIALSAAQQSHRPLLPAVEPLTDIEQVIAGSGAFDLKLIPALIDERRALSGIFKGSNARNILVLIGPEGDFTPEELGMARGAGFIPVTLGSQVLRVDTAAVAVASFIKLFHEDR